MRFNVITPPADPAVSLADMKQHLRVDDGDDDAFIESLTAGAQAGFESPEMGILGRPVVYQKVEIEADCSDGFPVRLYGPIDTDEDVVIVYRNSANADVTIDPASYLIDREDTFAPRLVVYSSWPYGNNIRIRCWVGLDVDDPRMGNFQSAVKMHVEKIYDGGDNVDALDKAIYSLLSTYRVMVV